MESQWTKKIIHEIGLNHMLKDKTVRDIVSSQFEILRDNIRESDPENGIMPTIRLTELITFKVKPNKLKWLKGRKRYLRIRKERNLRLKTK